MSRLVVALLIVMLGAALFVDAAAEGAFAPPATHERIAFERDGPVLRIDGALARGATGFGREAIIVAPGARAPRQIAEAMRSRGARATFALSARDVVSDDSLMRDLAARGQEIAFAGIGDDVDALPEPFATAVEVVGLRMLEADAAVPVVAFAGASVLLARPDTAQDVARAERIGLVAVTASPPPADASAFDGLVVVSDAGEAIAELDRARSRGVAVVPVSQIAGNQRTGGLRALDVADGTILLSVARVLVAAHDALLGAALLATFLILLRLVIVAAVAVVHAHRRRPAAMTARVAVLVPAHNEERVVGACIRSLLASENVDLEVVVIDDGSRDDTAAAASRAAADDARVLVVRQENAGKAMALRRGFAATHADVIVVVDADSLVEPRSIAELVAPLADPRVGATAGNVKVGNRSSILGAPQHVEYVMGINLDRRFFDVVDAVTVVPGALGAFRREAIEAVGGFPADTLAEDADLTVAIGASGYRVRHVPAARVWTEVPITLRLLYRQRFRWSYGMLQVLWKHRVAIPRRAATNVARLGLPYLLVYGYALPMLAPALDILFVRDALLQRSVATLWLFAAFTLAQVFAAALAMRLDGESVMWSLLVVPMQLGYRQLLSAVTAAALWAALAGLPVSWGAQARRGLAGISIGRAQR